MKQCEWCKPEGSGKDSCEVGGLCNVCCGTGKLADDDPMLQTEDDEESSAAEARGNQPINLNQLAAEAHRIAVEHGFTDNTIGEDMALIHSEVSEALEDHRAGHKPSETWYESKQPIDKPCGIPSEMADVVIRVAHFCAKHGIDLDKAVAEKMEYNATRPYKHGKVM